MSDYYTRIVAEQRARLVAEHQQRGFSLPDDEETLIALVEYMAETELIRSSPFYHRHKTPQ